VSAKKKQIRPVFLVAMGIALAGVGLFSGIAFDLATRPASRSSANAPQVVRPLPARPQPPDIERPTGQPMRAWAPETPANAKPLTAFAVASSAAAGQPAIAIVIDDMGVDRARSLRMIDQKGPFTLSLMTYAEGLPDLVARARRAGHEVMAHLPMEPLDPKENPGRGALRVSMDLETIRATLAGDLDPWSGYVGINNHMGSRFTTDRARMDVVMRELRTRGLLWLDSKTIAGSMGTAAAQAAGVPYVERDVFIDNEQTVAAVLAQLAEAEKIARNRGTVIAIGHPHDATLDALRQWTAEVGGRGFALVPVTEILRRRTAGE
jgi:uncharacterized protein